jgi:hypothetical protein
VAPRAYWKGYLKLSLVSCPVALFPASSEREKISFNQINKKTGNRIKYRKVDAETGEEVDTSDIVKGYEVGKGQYIEIEPEELEAIAIESKRTIEIDEFVARKEIDELYLSRSCFQAAISSTRICLLGMRRLRHWEVRTPSSDSATVWRTRASPAPGLRTGTSSHTSTSGSPVW